METWYKATNVPCCPKIEEVAIERHTGNYVVIFGKRIYATTHHHSYFKTRQEAADFLMKKANKRIEAAKKELEEAQQYLEKVKNL